MATRQFSLPTWYERNVHRGRPKQSDQGTQTHWPTLRELLAELRRQAMGGVMPSMAAFDLARPANWPKAEAILGGEIAGMPHGTTWERLGREAGLLVKRGSHGWK